MAEHDEGIVSSQSETIQAWVSTEVKIGAKSVDVTSKSTVGYSAPRDDFDPGHLLAAKAAADTVAIHAARATKFTFDELNGTYETPLDKTLTDQLIVAFNAIANQALASLSPIPEDAPGEPEWVIGVPVEDVTQE